MQNECEKNSGNQYFLIPLSAHTMESLKARQSDLAQAKVAGSSIRNLAFTLNCRRSHLAYRKFMVSTESSLENDLISTNMKDRFHHPEESVHPYLFCFTGQGSQWLGMGAGLMSQFPVVSKVIDDLNEHLRQLPNPPAWDLRGFFS